MKDESHPDSSFRLHPSSFASTPMNVTFTCPHCQAVSRSTLEPMAEELVCSACGQAIPVPAGALDGERLHRCVVCPSTDLFVRKDFPQRLGVWIVTLGIAASCVAWGYYLRWLTYAILFATALADVVLYLVVPNALMCYRCGAQYRGASDLDSHAPFDLEVHERHRQQKIRLEELRAGAGREAPPTSD